MEILQFPHPALLKKCQEVTVFGEELRVILDKMYDTMLHAKGLGLAANQLGLDMNCFTMLSGDKRLDLINPSIVDKSKAISSLEEGCLSAPGERLNTGNRSVWVNVSFQDLDGNRRTKLFEGIESICIAHELDHLAGKAFFQTNTISKDKRTKLCKKWGLK
jgi:peptide deformylase